MRPESLPATRQLRRAGTGIRRSGPSSDLPLDLKHRSTRRVAVFAWIILAVAAVDSLVDHGSEFFSNSAYPNREHLWDLLGVATITVLSAGVIALMRAKRVAVDAPVWGGVGYLVCLAFFVAATDSADGWWMDERGADHFLRGTPALVSIMLVFPVVVPMTYRRAAAVALSMSAMGPWPCLWTRRSRAKTRSGVAGLDGERSPRANDSAALTAGSDQAPRRSGARRCPPSPRQAVERWAPRRRGK